MNHQGLNKFFIRFFLVFLIHFIIKVGDQTFTDFLSISFRGLVFTIQFSIYWIIIWYTADYINYLIIKREEKKLEPKRVYTLLRFSFHLLFGLAVSFSSNLIYRFGDIYFFDMSETWSPVPLVNLELTLSLSMIYMMVFTFDTYYSSSMKLKEEQLQMEKLKQENTLAQYLNLKSQIEPHFLFNSLSVLNSIIYSDVDLASEFILRLSRILRYVIEKNEFIMVPLSEEITFVENYLFLIKTRFDEGIAFENTIDKNILDSYYVPPASLQLLIENAIKHNKFTSSNPLHIHLSNTENCLTVSNNLNIRTDFEKSTNQGLDNLTVRYSHFTDQSISIKKTNTDFTVSLPLLTKEHYERFNI